MFAIDFIKEPGAPRRRGVAVGAIRIGAFSERFESPLGYWSEAQYERQWHSAIRHILNGGDRTALFTAFHDPADANFQIWWPMWRLDTTVHVQNGLLFMNALSAPFTPLSPQLHVPPRVTHSEGQPVSEWVTTLHALVNYIQAYGGTEGTATA